MTAFKVGELVKWHNTTGSKWRRGMIITADPHPSPSSSTTYSVLWANGEKSYVESGSSFDLTSTPCPRENGVQTTQLCGIIRVYQPGR